MSVTWRVSHTIEQPGEMYVCVIREWVCTRVTDISRTGRTCLAYTFATPRFSPSVACIRTVSSYICSSVHLREMTRLTSNRNTSSSVHYTIEILIVLTSCFCHRRCTFRTRFHCLISIGSGSDLIEVEQTQRWKFNRCPCHPLLLHVFRSIGFGHKGSDSFHSERNVTRYHVLDLVTRDSPRPKLHCQLYIYNLTFSEGVMSAIHAGRYSPP